MADTAVLTAELASLDARRLELDQRLRESVNRQRHSSDPGDRARAAMEEQEVVAALDKLMTRIRAVEGKLLLARQGRRQPWT